MHEHDIISFIAHHAVVDIHYHNCIQIMMSLNSGFDCAISGQKYKSMKGYVVNKGVKHSCNAPETSIIVYLIENESKFGRELNDMLANQDFIDIENLLTPKQLQEIYYRYELAASIIERQSVGSFILENILPDDIRLEQSLPDERIQTVLEFINRNIERQISLEEVAQLLYLSPERTRHIFAKQIGIPFSQYVLWKRIKYIIVDVVKNGMNLNEASMKYGFTDQAHFCKIFKRMFGAPAKPFLKKNEAVQFLVPEAS